jgi:LmbE family N-acetylglucosaminyl deacetylase
MSPRTPHDRHVDAWIAALSCGAEPGVPATAGAVATPVRAAAPCCLVFSPHPDDEALSGGLALRLRQRHGWRVVNVALTLGSRLDRRAARWAEAQASCDYLGFELLSPLGVPGRALERIRPEAAAAEPAHWAHAAGCAAALLRALAPRVVLAPHAGDGHPAHIGTHGLVRDALAACGDALDVHLLWSEYWMPQPGPRLMLGLAAGEVAQLMTATALHAGEVARHPYHLSLPALLIDSARRGAELIGGLGGTPAGVAMAALYGWERWRGGFAEAMPPFALGQDDDLDALLGPGSRG